MTLCHFDNWRYKDMRNKHKFSAVKIFRCPYENCGKEFEKTITIEYVTNQKGDVIEHKII